MKRAGRFKKMLVGTTVSLLLFAALGEILFRVAYAPLSSYGTEMWRYAMEVKRLRPGDADCPFDHRPNAKANLYGVDFRTNAEGGRDDHDWGEKNPDTCRIAFVGDSITVGWGVEFEDMYSEVVERELIANNPSKRFKTFESTNLGIGNYNTVMEYKLFSEKIGQLKPDIIVLCYYINDAQPTPVADPGFLKKNSYLFAFLTELKNRVYARTGARGYKETYNSYYEDSAPAKGKTRDALQNFARLAKSKGIPLVVFVIPELHDFKDYPFQHVTDFVRESTKDVRVVDLLPDFQTVEDATSLWVTPEDHHPNAEGHAIAAKRMTEVLAEMIRETEEPKVATGEGGG